MRREKVRLEDHRLYYFAICPYCIKVRLALWLMGIALPLREILLHPDNKAELIAGGGKQQVPCLRIEQEKGVVQWLYESGDIIRYMKQWRLANQRTP